MATHGPLTKPTMAAMPVLLFLTDHPDLVLVASSVGNSTQYHFSYANGGRYRSKNDNNESYMETDEDRAEYKNNDLAPKVTGNMATYRWLQSGWTLSIDKKKQTDKDGNVTNYWSWYDHPVVITDAGRAMANKWRSKYEKYAAKKAEKRKKVERLIVVRNPCGFGDSREYGFMARVFRETETRLYIERVHAKDEKQERWAYIPTLHGAAGNQYVERGDVIVDGVTPEQYLCMRAVESKNMAWLASLKQQEDAEVLLIREHYQARRDQNKYAVDDELRDELEKIKT